MDNKPQETVFVVSAHAGDFIWRAGGAIATYKQQGYKVRILCLSFGENGESKMLWEAGLTLEQIKEQRRREAEKAASVLGAEIRFFDIGDYPLEVTPELKEALVDEFRQHRTRIVLTHSKTDPYNIDHERTHQLTIECCILANYGVGFLQGLEVTKPIQIFVFEPHQSEMSKFEINTFLDITSVFELKRKAMECVPAQQQVWEYYTELARQRGVQASRNSGNKNIIYAEAFQRMYPQVVSVLK